MITQVWEALIHTILACPIGLPLQHGLPGIFPHILST